MRFVTETVLRIEAGARILRGALGAAEHLAEGFAVTRSYGSPQLAAAGTMESSRTGQN